MAKVQHNTPNEKRLKRLYGGEGNALMRDRGIDAQTVFDPKDVDKWLKAGVDKTDLQGFDTTDAREPSLRQLGGQLKKGSGLGYVESEPERFVQHGMESFKQLSRFKDEIIGYNSFKKAVEKAWSSHSQGDKGLHHLFKEMTEGDFVALYETSEVQSWVRQAPPDKQKVSQELRGQVITHIMKRYNIERGRATTKYDSLSLVAQDKLLTRFRLRTERQAKRMAQPSRPEGILTTNVSRRGKVHVRTLPQKWTPIQVTFMRNNSQLPPKQLHELYSHVFRTSPRTYTSIRFKRQRLARAQTY